MASFNFYLRSAADKSKENSLYLYVTISRLQRITLNTGVRVAAKNWNNKQRCFRSSAKGAPEKNAELQKMKAKVELSFMKNRDQSFDDLKIKLQSVISPIIQKTSGVPTVAQAFEAFIEDMTGVFSDNYLRGYLQVINFVQGKASINDKPNELISKQRNITIDKVGATYLNDYVRWMIAEGYLNATIKKHVKFLKKVLNVNADLYELDGSHSRVKNIKVSDNKPFWLSHDEIKLIIDHEFSSQRRQQVADEWLFRYYSSLRDQDSEQLQQHHVRVVRGVPSIDFNMMKNTRDFIMPLSDAAVEILERYDYCLPKFSNQEKNRIIKLCFQEVGLNEMVERVSTSGSRRVVNLQPKWKWVTTHTARRSFGRRWMDTVGDIETLSQYMGHSSSAVTRAYIGWELEEFASFVKQLDFT